MRLAVLALAIGVAVARPALAQTPQAPPTCEELLDNSVYNQGAAELGQGQAHMEAAKLSARLRAMTRERDTWKAKAEAAEKPKEPPTP